VQHGSECTGKNARMKYCAVSINTFELFQLQVLRPIWVLPAAVAFRQMCLPLQSRGLSSFGVSGHTAGNLSWHPTELGARDAASFRNLYENKDVSGVRNILKYHY
jgi:hypothetical protein